MMATLDLDDLRSDGDVVDLPDGRKLRLRIEPDEDASINDYDSDGRIEWTRDTWRGSVRPDGFNGAARIIERDGGSSLWWQPPGLDITGTPWDAATFRAEETRIRELARYGFSVVILEVLEGTDAYGRPVVANFASLGAVDGATGDYLAEIVRDLAGELDL